MKMADEEEKEELVRKQRREFQRRLSRASQFRCIGNYMIQQPPPGYPKLFQFEQFQPKRIAKNLVKFDNKTTTNKKKTAVVDDEGRSTRRKPKKKRLPPTGIKKPTATTTKVAIGESTSEQSTILSESVKDKMTEIEAAMNYSLKIVRNDPRKKFYGGTEVRKNWTPPAVKTKKAQGPPPHASTPTALGNRDYRPPTIDNRSYIQPTPEKSTHDEQHSIEIAHDSPPSNDRRQQADDDEIAKLAKQILESEILSSPEIVDASSTPSSHSPSKRDHRIRSTVDHRSTPPTLDFDAEEKEDEMNGRTGDIAIEREDEIDHQKDEPEEIIDQVGQSEEIVDQDVESQEIVGQVIESEEIVARKVVSEEIADQEVESQEIVGQVIEVEEIGGQKVVSEQVIDQETESEGEIDQDDQETESEEIDDQEGESEMEENDDDMGDDNEPQQYNDDESALEMDESVIHPAVMEIDMDLRRSIASRGSIMFDYEAAVYKACHQPSGPVPWSKAFPARILDQCRKIGEGSFGEVFLMKDANGEWVAVKIVPIEGDFDVNENKQKPFKEIYPEIDISLALSNLRNQPTYATPNFIEVKRVHCVKGAYPKKLLAAWNAYTQEKVSENESPSIFGRNQLFIVFVFANGGRDLENVELASVAQAKSIVNQVTLTLAIAEERLQFEHRDLHIGNVLVKETNEQEIAYLYNGKRVSIQSHGVHVFIIDCTNARYTNPVLKQVQYIDLEYDEGLFQGPDTEYQFDIYRMMRILNGKNWKSFNPRTNIYWLDYLADKLVSMKKYAANRNQRMRKNQAEPFLALRHELLERYENCTQLIRKHEFFDDIRLD